MDRSSRIPGFYKLPLEERLKIVAEWAKLSKEEQEILKNFGNLGEKLADTMIENVIGTMAYPLGIATNFRINERDYLIPMVIEESSVVAAASNAAKMLREGGGIYAKAGEQLMISQIYLSKVKAPYYALGKIMKKKEELIDMANQQDPVLVKLGGGAKDLTAEVISTRKGEFLRVHLIVNVLDAMGANAVNTMAEALAPELEKITGGKARLRILSNLAKLRVVRAWAKTPVEAVGGEEVAEGIEEASAIAEADPYRAATHNKGIMNGIIAVALATGQDHRAIEAGAHAYAALRGRYTSLSRWEVKNGYLTGYLELPLQVGVVGGATKVHPVSKICLKILGVQKASELSEVMAAVGLAQNLAALRALVAEGIQRGHMKLHARNLAVMAGAEGDLIDKVAEEMIKRGKIGYHVAKEILEEMKKALRFPF